MAMRAVQPTVDPLQVRDEGSRTPPTAVASALVRDGSAVEAIAIGAEGAGPPELIVIDLADRPVRAEGVAPRIRSLAKAYPGVPLVLVSGVPSTAEVEAAEALGARGFISGIEPVRVAIAALRLVAAGGSYLPRGREVLDPQAARELPGGGFAHLTRREIQVLHELATGASNRDIAARLGLSENTVKVYVRNLMRKMNARNRLEVASRAGRAP